MRKILFLLIVLTVLLSESVLAVEIKTEVYNPPLPYHKNVDWSTDNSLSTTEPFGKISGVYRNSNTTLYAAIPDTNILSAKQ
ncbi:MAG: hypothetical protein JSS63_02620 [Bacteroidetes bacterium]|nr:hypothetical protein [Bacteroidota bacterium]